MATMMVNPRTNLAGILAIGDPDGARRVIALVAILVALGVALLMTAVWLYRTTRPDPELLAPLEVMSDRAWRRGDPVWQRRRLDEVRPAEASPLTRIAAPPELDSDYDAGPSASGFDDFEPVDAIAEQMGEHAATHDRIDAATPPGISRVDLDAIDEAELSDETVPPEVLAAAIAELDTQLGDGVQGNA